MGFLDKLAFWKKKDDIGDIGGDLGLDKNLGLDIGSPSPDLGMGIEPQQPYQKYPSFQPMQSFQPVQQPMPNDSYIASKNLEVISSKLDALRASLESMNQRLANIEAIARGEQDQQRKKYY